MNYKWKENQITYYPKKKTLKLTLELSIKQWVLLKYDSTQPKTLREIADMMVLTYETKEGHISTGLKMITKS